MQHLHLCNYSVQLGDTIIRYVVIEDINKYN